MGSWLRTLMSWFALACLVALFELPMLLLSESARLTADLFVLVAGYLVSFALGARLGRALRWALGLYAALLVLYRIDRAAFLVFMGQEPLLYDQLFMLKLLLVLLSDLWSWEIAAALLAVPLVVAAVVLATRALLRLTRGLARPPARRPALLLLAIVCAGAWFGESLPWVGQYAPRWVTPALVANLQRSREIYASVRRQLRSSPYRGVERLTLQRRPDIYVIMLESYGRVLVDRDSMRGPWLEQMRSMEATLSRAGFHAASAFSTAPVAGGRSWLAEGSILTGIHIDYEAVFHHLVGEIKRLPNLVSLLAKQGYHTVLLAPADRVRQGVEEVNYYDYQRVVRFDDLKYTGQKLGWGLVPDQYSLGHTDEHVLRRAPRPLFFNYHMVSSHAPWKEVPELVDDWRALNQVDAAQPDAPEPKGTLKMRLKRYRYMDPRFMNMGALRYTVGRAYQAAIQYDLKLLERYLPTIPGDALVFLIGDHQPPFVAAETTGFDTMVHVLARDPRLLEEFKAQGFKDGMQLRQDAVAAVRHEGLFSLIVRALARCCGGQQPLPAYLPEGTRY